MKHLYYVKYHYMLCLPSFLTIRTQAPPLTPHKVTRLWKKRRITCKGILQKSQTT